MIQEIEATLGVRLDGEPMSKIEAIQKQENAERNAMLSMVGGLLSSIALTINVVTEEHISKSLIYKNGRVALDKAIEKGSIDNYVIKNKHLDVPTNTTDWSKFNVSSVEEAKQIVIDTINNGQIVDIVKNKDLGNLGQQAYVIIFDAGKTIGTKGERFVRIVVDELGNTWSMVPSKN